jgi:hypothetical protein
MGARGIIGIVIAGSILLPGCRVFRAKRTPPPVITAPPASRTPPAEPPTVPAPPPVEAAKTTPPPPRAATVEVKPPAKPQPKPTRRPPKKVTTAKAQPPVTPQQTPPAETPAAPSEPIPQLTQMLSPAEEAAYNRAIDVAVENAKANVTKVSGRRLNSTQRGKLERINAFLKQVEETRARDLATAKTIAERAYLLSDELVKN